MEGQSQATSSTTLKQLGIRACGTCVKAKARCIPGSESRECLRCRRLGKDCRPSSPGARKRPKSTQVAQLEKKLDSIVNLLRAGNSETRDDARQETPACVTYLPSPSRSTPSSNPHTQVAFLDEVTSQLGCPNPGRDQPDSEFRPTHQPSTSVTYDFNLGTEEADLLLADFRLNMAHHIPFVIIPPFLTSNDLRRDKPVLWKAVAVATLYSQPERQEALGWKFMEEISTRMLLKAEKSLDLLQGILVHVCWYQYHAVLNPQVTNLLGLARSLVASLGYLLTRTVKDRRQLLMDDVEDANRTTMEAPIPGSEKLQQFRALAGCFSITSVAVCNCKAMSPFQYSSQIEESCKTLADIQEYQSDRIIVQLCELQNIAMKISNLYHEPTDSMGNSVPVKWFIKVLQTELEGFKANLPADLHDKDIITSNYQTAEISLYELGLYSAFYPKSEKAHRLHALYACLLAVKSYFNTNFSNSASFSPSDPYVKWVQMGYVLLMGLKLSICVADGWDLDHARKILDFPTHLNILIGKLEIIQRLRQRSGRNHSAEAETVTSRPDIFSRFLRQLRRFKAWFEPLVVDKTTSEVIVGAANPPPLIFGANSDLDVSMECFSDDLMTIDEPFWESLMNVNDDDWSQNWYHGRV